MIIKNDFVQYLLSYYYLDVLRERSVDCKSRSAYRKDYHSM